VARKSNNLCPVICYSDNIEKVGALFEENDDGSMKNEPKPLTSAFLISNAAMHFALMQDAAAAGKIMANKLPVKFGQDRLRVRLDRAGISPRFEIRVCR
jgi:hypothetical protein